jgi:hypothetical protein
MKLRVFKRKMKDELEVLAASEVEKLRELHEWGAHLHDAIEELPRYLRVDVRKQRS